MISIKLIIKNNLKAISTSYWYQTKVMRYNISSSYVVHKVFTYIKTNYFLSLIFHSWFLNGKFLF